MRYGYDMATAARTTENILAVDDVPSTSADMARRPRPSAARRSTARSPGPQRSTNAIETRLRRPDGVLVDGLEADGTPSTHASQIANAYALAFRLVPPPDR